MYVRRDCLDDTGILDSAVFPHDCDGENDFCLRAGQLGWNTVVDDATLLYHVHSKGIVDVKNEPIKQGHEVIEAHNLQYNEADSKLLSCDPLNAVHERLRNISKAISADKCEIKPRVMFVLSTGADGTPQTNQDLMTALDDRIEAFVLKCDATKISLTHYQNGIYVEMEMHVLREPIKAFPHRSEAYDAVVSSWIVHYAIELVHIRHIALHGMGLVDVSKALKLPVVFSFHDFYSVCPTVKLLDGTGQYCGGTCTTSSDQCQYDLWTELDHPALKNSGIYEWRIQFGTMLKKCDLFVTTAESAKKILIANYDFLADRDIHVIPHGRDFDDFEQIAPPIQKGETIRILIPGNISRAKGGEIIAELSRHTLHQQIEIHVLGNLSEDIKVTPGVICHGAYERSQFAEKVRAIKPHIGGIFSIWPETYCHTLTELWACGVPTIGFDFGAVGERIRESAAGWLAPEPTAQGVLHLIKHLHTNPEEHKTKLAAVRQWQAGTARVRDCQYMGDAYYERYCSLIYGQTLLNVRREKR